MTSENGWTRENSLPAKIEDELERAKQRVQREQPYQAMATKQRGRTALSRTVSSQNNIADGWSQGSREASKGIERDGHSS